MYGWYVVEMVLYIVLMMFVVPPFIFRKLPPLLSAAHTRFYFETTRHTISDIDRVKYSECFWSGQNVQSIHAFDEKTICPEVTEREPTRSN